MGFLKAISRAFCRLFGLEVALSAKPSASAAAVEPRSVFAPAVAGFVMRAPIDRFRLAARLASVARLNTPHGRKPRVALRRPADVPPIPAERLGAKKMRLNANRGPRVITLGRKPAAQINSNVVAFPAPARHQVGASAMVERQAA